MRLRKRAFGCLGKKIGAPIFYRRRSRGNAEWSTRIGLHGRWGDGKTTILNFLEVQQRKRDNIVIRYSPWGLQGEAKLWEDFAKALKDGLKRNGVSMAWYRSAWLWVKQKSG
jgi:KAP family P-loop domain